MPPDQGAKASGGGSIEFLPPDERAFGPVDDHTFSGVDEGDWAADDDADGAPRSPWATVLAGLAVVAILAVGVVAAAPWAGDDAATAPATTVPSNSTPATSATPPSERAGTGATADGASPTADPAERGWILDPVPTGMRPVQFVGRDRGLDEGSGWGEVWVAPGATRTSGRWFSLTMLPFRSLDPGTPTWFPVDVAGRAGLADVGPDGVLTLAWDAGVPDAERLMSLDANGFSLTELVELADSIGIVDDRPQMVDDRPEFRRPELIDGLVRIAAAPTEGDLVTRALLGGRRTSVAFYAGDRPWDVTLVQEQPDGAAWDDPLLALATGRILVEPPPGLAGGDIGFGLRSVGAYDLIVARWTTGDGHTLSVMSTGTVDDVRAAIGSVRLATAEEWRSLEQGDGEGFLGRRTPPGRTLLTGELPDGREWSALQWERSDELELRVGTESTFQPIGERPLRVLTVGDASFVVALTDVSPAGVEVRTPATTSTAPFVGTTRAATDGTARTSYIAVVPLPDPRDAGSFTAEIVGPTGGVVARLAPWG